MKEEDVNYIHLHHFKKIPTNFFQPGYNIKNAKCHNNVIEEAMFHVPVDQVFVMSFLSN